MNIVAIVDGTEQQVYSAIDKLNERARYSGKKRLHTFTLLIVCSPQGKIYWISDSYNGSLNDKNLVDLAENREFFQQNFKQHEWIAGDLGFKGMWQYCSTQTPITPNRQPLTPYEQQFNKEFKSIRIVVENTIGQIKNWNICSSLFRHNSIHTHHKIWYIACSLWNAFGCNLRCENDE